MQSIILWLAVLQRRRPPSRRLLPLGGHSRWERGDDSYHKLIESKIRYEYDLWAKGGRYHY
ncbi:hypothetical protein H4W31_006627 [Plantactinospora soyae]|uniref:Uncharacterized protein n=1 Tax=Plantactinospora soyae TaxID=1544732 RepID=A0A927MAM8_9ACTN|nr:hypothetical protein [Plantactinospora soyae]